MVTVFTKFSVKEEFQTRICLQKSGLQINHLQKYMKVLTKNLMKKFFYSISFVMIFIGIFNTQSPLFANDEVNVLPKGWVSSYTNIKDKVPLWRVLKEEGVASKGQVLRLVKTEAHGSEFNLCYTKKIKFLNGAITVVFKANNGHEDQGGGIIWRVKDNNNYYVARYNPLEDNFCLYYVKNGYRRILNSATVALDKRHWHIMKIIQHKNHYVAYLDSKKVLEGEDATFKNIGGVGIWTKADALTSFKDFKVTEEN